jgi:hypothetical protein
MPNHKDNGGGRGKHILATNRTIALQVSLDALVFAHQTDRHANITLFAMEIVDA